jgi:hypothetical protein
MTYNHPITAVIKRLGKGEGSGGKTLGVIRCKAKKCKSHMTAFKEVIGKDERKQKRGKYI